MGAEDTGRYERRSTDKLILDKIDTVNGRIDGLMQTTHEGEQKIW